MILGCGEALIDMVPYSGGLYKPCCGGSPYNTIIAAGRLGVRAAFLARFSRDFFGEMLFERLKENHVDTRFIRRTCENTMLAFVKLEDGKEPLYTFYTEGTASVSFGREDIPQSLPPEISCIYFGSVALTMEPVGSSIEVFAAEQSARRDGPALSYDPNVRPLVIKDRNAFTERAERLVSFADIVKISKADMEYLYPGLSCEAGIEKILSTVPAGTTKLVVCTLGKYGAEAALKTGAGRVVRARAGAVDLPVMDTIGAGDTFHGAFLSFLEINGKLSRPAIAALTERELSSALLFANKAASLVCSREGADPPTLAELEQFDRLRL
jgi:fructokinase